MTVQREKAVQYSREHRENFLKRLQDLVTIPSISTDPDHHEDMKRAAEWLAKDLRATGLENIQIFPTAGHPIVYADWMHAADAPTVLIYGHYDVQPVEPLEEWKQDAFSAGVEGDHLFGRGSSDMKGQVIASIGAVESILKQGPMPVNVKFMLEGEEEIGSPNLPAFMESHKDLLTCDIALNPDAGMIASDIPTIVYGLRGLAYFELRVRGSASDLHSGMFGGVVHNAAQALCELIAGMHDENGRITLPGFYDSVRSLTEQERSEMARLPMDEAFYRKQAGISQTWGEAGYSPAERVGARPTLEINGMLSGFTAAGAKTVIPAVAMAKISCRLVPNQTPQQVYQQMLAYLKAKAPQSITWELIDMHGAPASVTDPDLPETRALANALESAWGTRPVYKREGGSIPVVGAMQTILGVESVLTGFGLPGDNVHAPNEHMHLPTWYRGIEALVYFFYNMKELKAH
jgi:acetylornithine deacetylase/succinyl-diaminopimelate desuccinylase-like protein